MKWWCISKQDNNPRYFFKKRKKDIQAPFSLKTWICDDIIKVKDGRIF